jgi:hypothetical protein
MRGDEGLAGNGSLDVLPRELSSIIASSLKPEEHVLWQGMGESKYHIAKRIHAYVVYIFVCIVIAALLLDLLDWGDAERADRIRHHKSARLYCQYCVGRNERLRSTPFCVHLQEVLHGWRLRIAVLSRPHGARTRRKVRFARFRPHSQRYAAVKGASLADVRRRRVSRRIRSGAGEPPRRKG